MSRFPVPKLEHVRTSTRRKQAVAARERERSAIPRATWKDSVLPVVAAGGALLVAVVGALITGSSPGQVNVGVENASASAGAFIDDASTFVPLGFAFGAGMVSAVNPCGFTMLPVYLGLYLRAADGEAYPVSARLLRALLVGGTVTAGFVALFAVMGTALGIGAQILVDALPWIGLIVGIAMVAVGSWLVGGHTLNSALGERLGARMGDPRHASTRGFFLFGLSYGTASLSCTLPVFLSVVGGSVVAGGPLAALGQFILYGLGMGSVIVGLTVSVASFNATLVQPLRGVQPYVDRISAVFALVAGAYIVYYWLTLGGLLETFV